MSKYFLVFLFFVAACNTAPQRTQVETPLPVPNAPSAGPAKGLPAAPPEIPNVAVILGPGGAKGLAHAGVLKALHENRIPIGKVVGVEWGALVGAAFAAHGQPHEVDWKLYKLDQIDMSNKGGGFFGLGRNDRTIKILDGYLKENFGNIDVTNTKIPFSCPARSYWTGALVWQSRGLLSDAVRKCLPFPPLFQTHGSWQAAATHLRQVVSGLKAEGYKLVVFVDVLGTASPFEKEKLSEDSVNVILWQDVQRSIAEAEAMADETIRVPTEGIFIDRFESRKELLQIGEAEGIKAAQRLMGRYGF